MVIRKNNKCIKLRLPNNKVVDILSSVLDEIYQWLQDEEDKPESGGYIVGYKHDKTGNISLEAVSQPCLRDGKGRTHFSIRDKSHKYFLSKAYRKKSYYMGVWHTHPQIIPTPSSVDWSDWCDSVHQEKTGCDYIFFLIAGTEEVRIWVGDFYNGNIVEIFECPKDEEGLYGRSDEDGKSQ